MTWLLRCFVLLKQLQLIPFGFTGAAVCLAVAPKCAGGQDKLTLDGSASTTSRSLRRDISLCLHALSSFQRTGYARRVRPRGAPPDRPLGPFLGEPSKVSIDVALCQPIFTSFSLADTAPPTSTLYFRSPEASGIAQRLFLPGLRVGISDDRSTTTRAGARQANLLRLRIARPHVNPDVDGRAQLRRILTR